MHANPKGVLVPDSGDDLLTAFDMSMSSAGTIKEYSSIAEFRQAVMSAAAAGRGPSSGSPWYGDVQGIVYKCSGYAGANGAVDLAPVNEVEWGMSPLTGWTHNDSYTLANGESRVVHAVTLKPRSYPRLCFSTCSLWGRVTKGEADCVLNMANKGKAYARFPDASDGNVSTSGAVVVGAGEEARFEACVVGGGGNNGSGGSVQADSSHSSTLTVIAWPVAVS